MQYLDVLVALLCHKAKKNIGSIDPRLKGIEGFDLIGTRVNQ